MTKLIETACTYDCPDACSLLVQKSSDGTLIKGNPDHPITRGYVCKRIRKHLARLSSPNRITSPLLRSGSGFKEVDWNVALDKVAGVLDSVLCDSPAGVLHVAGGGSLGVRKLLVNHFFNSLGMVTTLDGGVCDETGMRAQKVDFGDSCAHDYTDLNNSRSIVLWGRNPSITGIHLLPFIRAARTKGARVTLIDLWKTPTAVYCDDFIRVAPGGDASLALAVLKHLLDRDRIHQRFIGSSENFDELRELLKNGKSLTAGAGVDEDAVAKLAKIYSIEKPVATMIGWGLQRRSGGGHAVRAIDALCALSGNVGIAGAGANYNPGRLRGLDSGMLAKSNGPTLEVPFFARGLRDRSKHSIGFVYINGANPVAQFSESLSVRRSLRSGPFIVVADAFMTDTARCADVVLPTTLMLEEDHDAVGSYAHHFVAKVRRALDPPEGVMEDVEIVRNLGKKLGLAADPLLEDPKACVENMTSNWFRSNDSMFCRNPCQPEVPFESGFSTPSGKLNLMNQIVDVPDTPGDFPLLLLSPKKREFQNSQMEPHDQRGDLVCYVNPAAVGVDGMDEGQVVRLKSHVGCLEVRLVFRQDLHPEVCVVEQGGWLKFNSAVNVLVEQRSTDMDMGTAFYDQRVRIEVLGQKK